MRNSGIAHMEDVAWAILEPQGKLSFIGRQKSEGSAEDDERPET
jgi:uncharacterized membrane protein YcaP (DUF421 family)